MSSRSIRLRIVYDPALKDGIVIPKTALTAFGLTRVTEANVAVGATQIVSKIMAGPSDGKTTTMRMGKRQRDAFSLPLPRTMQVMYDTERDALRIGPVIAVFTCTRPGVQSASRTLFGVRTQDVRLLLRHGRNIGALTYALTPAGVHAGRTTVDGFVMGKGKWVSRTYPMPDVIYDRVQSRRWERESATVQAKDYLASNKAITWFNTGFFDKWTLHQKMVGSRFIDKYLPHTEEVTNKSALQFFVRLHGSIYIKPSEGSLGAGVIRVSRVRFGYEWRAGRRTQFISGIDALFSKVQRQAAGRHYIMQQDLRLATFRRSPFDVRILMQKNASGKWMRTKTYARVAARGRVTSNISLGGTGVGLGGVLKARFKNSRHRIRRNVARAARQIAAGLDDIFDGTLGEIGLDLGISQTGRIWLIEVNSKPFRKVTDAGSKKAIFRSFRRPMAYAKYLSGFGLAKP